MFAEGSSPEPRGLGRTLSIKAGILPPSLIIFVVSDRAARWLSALMLGWRDTARFRGLPVPHRAGGEVTRGSGSSSSCGDRDRRGGLGSDSNPSLGAEPARGTLCPCSTAARRRTPRSSEATSDRPRPYELFCQRHPQGAVAPRLPSDQKAERPITRAAQQVPVRRAQFRNDVAYPQQGSKRIINE